MQLDGAASISTPAEASPEVPAPKGATPLILSLVLIVLVLAAFQPAVLNDFVVYDDADYVTSNAMVQRGLAWRGVKWAFSATDAANWHPLTWLSHMFDVQLFGLNPAGHHLTSIVLHAVNTLLVFVVLRTLTGAMWQSFIVAALFGLHPLRVESVAWIAERKDVLSAGFGLLALLAYANFARARENNQSKPVTPFVCAVLCFACSLMCKPMLVTLPFVFLLLDAWPLKRFGKKPVGSLILEKAPFFLLSAISSLITVVCQRNAGAVNETMSLGYRVSSVLISYTRYLGKLVWPEGLAFFYPHPDHWPIISVLAAIVLLLAVSLLGIRLRGRHPGVLVGWCWYLGTLVPVIGLIQVGQQSIADRYTYMPSIGVFVALVWGIRGLVAGRKVLARAAMVVALGAILVCLILTRQQIRVWKNSESLCRHALAVTRNNYLAHDMLGDSLEKQGRHAAATSEHLEALRIKPDYADAHNNLAVALQHQGQLADALNQYRIALRLRPRYPQAHFNLGVALEQSGELTNAAAEYAEAISQRPNFADAHYNLGIVLGRLGRLDQAVQQFQETLRINPGQPDVYNNLGVTLDRMGRLDQAIGQYEMAVRAKPDYARAHFNLGVALGKTGRLEAAAREFEEALRLKPDYAEAQTNLGLIRSSRKQ